jgi:hypothetical protein
MIQSRALLLLAVMTTVWPSLSDARGLRRHQRPLVVGARVTPLTLPTPDLTLAKMNLDPRIDRTSPALARAWRPQDDEIATTVSRQLTPYGPVGSLGLVRFAVRGGLDSSALGNAIASRPAPAPRRLGANLTYRFR